MRIRAAGWVCVVVAPAAMAQRWQPVEVANVGAGCTYDVARGRTVVFGGFAGTREFDGQHWSAVRTAHSPSLRGSPSVTYDLVRRRVVLVGGYDTATHQVRNDTWEYDGVDWYQMATMHSPNTAFDDAVTYDWYRAVVVLLSGQQTWEYDGRDWTQRTTLIAPPPRQSARIAFQLDGKIILFGGLANVPINDTWEYDGTHWSQVLPLVAPPARFAHGLAYDVARDCLVMQGGHSNNGWLLDTWEYRHGQWTLRNAGQAVYASTLLFDWSQGSIRLVALTSGPRPGETWLYRGGAWVQSILPPYPSPRAGHVMVHDPVRDVTMIHGGGWPPLGDTWEYANGAWARTPAAPAGRSWAAAAYDASHRRIVMFGGATTLIWPSSYASTDQTWMLDANGWSLAATSTRPAPRYRHAMAYDSARSRIVLFGGASSAGWYGDTWEFDGQQWTNTTPAASPLFRFDHAMAYDASRSRTVLFGGGPIFNYMLADTWEYDGATWTNLPSAGGPGTTRAPGGLRMTYDPLRGKLLLIGESLWEFDGSVWRVAATPISPAILPDSGLVYTQRDGVLLFGGLGSTMYADLWSFQTAESATWTRHGAGCGIGTAIPSLDSTLPTGSVLGTTITVRLSAAGADVAVVAEGLGIVQWNGVALPLPLDNMPVPGCQLWIEPTLGTQTVGLQSGLGTLPITIPPDPTLAGLPLCLQAMTGNSTVGLGSLALTNAGVLRVY